MKGYIQNLDDIKNFVSGCNKIAENLNKKSESEKLIVIAPGDSPSKIVKYIQTQNLCKNCIFISFSLSKIDDILSDPTIDPKLYPKAVDYIKGFLPVNDNVVIIDFISQGSTMKAISDAYRNKARELGAPGRFDFPDKITIEKTADEIAQGNKLHILSENIISESSRIIHLKEENSLKSQEFKNIIEITQYFGKSTYLYNSDLSNTRCIIKNNIYEKLLAEQNYERFHNLYGLEYALSVIPGCELFLQIAILYSNKETQQIIEKTMETWNIYKSKNSHSGGSKKLTNKTSKKKLTNKTSKKKLTNKTSKKKITNKTSKKKLTNKTSKKKLTNKTSKKKLTNKTSKKKLTNKTSKKKLTNKTSKKKLTNKTNKKKITNKTSKKKLTNKTSKIK